MGAEILVYKSKRNEIAVRKTDEYEYEAKSESKERKWYRIAHVLGKWYCECKGFAHTGRACKHIAAMKKLYDAKPPPAAPCRGYQRLRKARRLGRAIKTPPIKCRFCRSKKFGTSFVRKNEHCNVQVYRCHNPKCGRRFSPDDGFLHMTYRGDTVVRAIEDRCGDKTTHNILDSLHKTSEKPARSTLHTWFVKFPRVVSEYLFTLPYQLSPVMLVDEIMAKVGGIMYAINSTQDEGTRMCTAIQFGRRKGSHNVRRLYKMDMDIRGFVPELVKSDGAWGFSSAHKATMRYNDSGTTSFHIRHIHADGDMNTNMKEKHNDTMREFERSCRGLKTPHTTYMAMHQIHYNFARTHTELGMRPSEAAGVRFEDPDKWRAIIACAADFNCDKEARRRNKTSGCDLPRRAGFQVVPLFRH